MTAHFYTIDQYESLINRVQAIETYLAQNFNVLKNAMNNLKSKQFIEAVQKFHRPVPNLIGKNISDYSNGRVILNNSGTDYFVLDNTGPNIIDKTEKNGTIKKQFPSPNTQVSIGSVISVTTTSGGK
jgi:hypothetical protein